MTRKLISAMTVALLCVTWAGQAKADLLGSDYHIASANPIWYSGIGYGGLFQSTAVFPSSSTPVALAGNYCIQYFNEIGLGGHDPFIYNTQGYIDGKLVTHAQQIAYLEVTYANVFTTLADQSALQQAIWSLYGGTSIPLAPAITGSTGTAPNYDASADALATSLIAEANNYVAHGFASHVGQVLWISTFNQGTYNGQGVDNAHWLQAQVALLPPGFSAVPVPEPTSLALLGLGGLGAVVNSIRRRRSPKAAA